MARLLSCTGVLTLDLAFLSHPRRFFDDFKTGFSEIKYTVLLPWHCPGTCQCRVACTGKWRIAVDSPLIKQGFATVRRDKRYAIARMDDCHNGSFAALDQSVGIWVNAGIITSALEYIMM